MVLGLKSFSFGEYHTNYTEMLKGGMICVRKIIATVLKRASGSAGQKR